MPDTRRSEEERRKYPRYDAELQVYFRVTYDIKTRVEFEVLESSHKDELRHKYSGLCKNVSAEGLSFSSNKKLTEGDILLLEVYEPAVRTPVKMEGQVRWSKNIPGKNGGKKVFRTGLKLISVNGRSVGDSIYFDKKYKIVWSAVLDALFGTFAAVMKKKSA